MSFQEVARSSEWLLMPSGMHQLSRAGPWLVDRLRPRRIETRECEARRHHVSRFHKPAGQRGRCPLRLRTRRRSKGQRVAQSFLSARCPSVDSLLAVRLLPAACSTRELNHPGSAPACRLADGTADVLRPRVFLDT